MENGEVIHFHLIEKNDKYVSIVEGYSGIISCSVPSESREDALQSLNNSAKLLNVMITNIENKKNEFSDLLFKMDENPKPHWIKANKVLLDFRLYTEKQRRVVESLRKTKPGETISYKKLGEIAGFQNAARFVGNTMANNHIPLIIPCHRVINSNNKIGNYSGAGGILVKRRYLEFEGVFL